MAGSQIAPLAFLPLTVILFDERPESPLGCILVRCRKLWRKYERSRATGRLQLHPAWCWDPVIGIARYLEVVWTMLNGEDYVAPAA